MEFLSEFEMTDIFIVNIFSQWKYFIIFHYKYTFINLIFKRLNKGVYKQISLQNIFNIWFFSVNFQYLQAFLI